MFHDLVRLSPLCSTFNPTGTLSATEFEEKQMKTNICIHAGRGINNICCCGRPLFTLDILVREQDQSLGPLGRVRVLLLLTRWLSVSCSPLTGHIYFSSFFSLLWATCWVLLPLLMSPSGQCAGSLSLRLQLFLSFLLHFLVMFFLIKKREKNVGKGITICQPAGILYIIY